MCQKLGIRIVAASTPQAKGRVERAHATLQDRLVKELRLAGISDLEAANAFLPGFMAHFNARFAVVPARSDDLHRPLNIPPDRLATLPSAPDIKKQLINYNYDWWIENREAAVGRFNKWLLS